MRRRRQRRIQGEVELNLAAMLDMAFQLLAFFILTFKPGSVEGQIALRMPLPMPVTNANAPATEIKDQPDESTSLAGLQTLTITALSDEQGEFRRLAIAQGEPVPDLQAFEARLKEIAGDPNLAFEQVVLQVGSRLRYERVMQLLDVCVRAQLASGEHIKSLSFVEIAESGDAAKQPG